MDEQEMKERVRRLEDQVKELKASVAAQTEAVTPAVIKAREFRLVDSEGRDRGGLALLKGNPVLSLMDKAGKAHTQLGLNPLTGEPALGLVDKEGKLRAELGLSPEGEPALVLKDKADTLRALFGSIQTEVVEMGEARGLTKYSLSLSDKDGKVVYEAP